MANFFIEFRFHGYAQRHLKKLIREVATKFKVKGAIKERPVPHMALFYGALGIFDIKKVCNVVKKVAENYTLVPFKIKGFEIKNGEQGKVLAASVFASSELKTLRKELSKELSRVCVTHRFDKQSDFWFHTTIAFKDIDKVSNRIRNYLKEKETLNINQHLVRITVLSKSRIIIGEYDLILKKWLNRREALDKRLFQKTISKLKGSLGFTQ